MVDTDKWNETVKNRWEGQRQQHQPCRCLIDHGCVVIFRVLLRAILYCIMESWSQNNSNTVQWQQWQYCFSPFPGRDVYCLCASSVPARYTYILLVPASSSPYHHTYTSHSEFDSHLNLCSLACLNTLRRRLAQQLSPGTQWSRSLGI